MRKYGVVIKILVIQYISLYTYNYVNTFLCLASLFTLISTKQYKAYKKIDYKLIKIINII